MKKIEELRNYLLENYVDEHGDLVISDLDFSDFNGDVYIDNMKVQYHLFQGHHEVQGNLWQNGHEVQGDLQQGGHEVQGDLYQYGHEVQGDLSQSYQKVKGNLHNGGNKYGGELYETPSTKTLKEVTAEELAELGYTLKGAKLK